MEQHIRLNSYLFHFNINPSVYKLGSEGLRYLSTPIYVLSGSVINEMVIYG